MKKTLLYSVIALALVLGLILPVTVMAQHSGQKDTEWYPADGHPKDVYLMGQTVYYSLNISNDSSTDSMNVTISDKVPVEPGTYAEIPGVTTTYWWNNVTHSWNLTDPGTPVIILPQESWYGTFNHTIHEDDVRVDPIEGYNVTVNQLFAQGTQGIEGVDWWDTKPIRVIQPEVDLVKTVTPSVAVPGQNVTYTFTINNMGDWPLEDITLVDSEFGDLTGKLPASLVLNATGEAGDSYSFDYEYEIQNGDLPLVNEATVKGTAQGFNGTIFHDAVVTDSDTARVISEAPPVGGTAYPVSKLAILVPWIALGGAIIAGATIFMRRRRVQS